MKNILIIPLIMSLAINLTCGLYVLNRWYGNKRPYPWNKCNIVILGDSRVSNCNWRDGLKRGDVKNSAISGIDAATLSTKLDSILEDIKPKVAVIQVGINDLRGGKSAHLTISSYERVVNKLLINKIKPVIISTIPIRKDFWQDDLSEQVVNQKTDSLNIFIRALCAEKKIAYVDVVKKLAPSIRLHRDFTYDGIHLNDSGNEILYSYVNSYLASKNL